MKNAPAARILKMACNACVEDKLNRICDTLEQKLVKAWLLKRLLKIMNEKCDECPKEEAKNE